MKIPRVADRLMSNERARNGIAIIAGLSTVALFLKSAYAVPTGSGGPIGFLARYWPHVTIVPLLLFWLLYIWSEVIRRSGVDVKDHRFVSLTTPVDTVVDVRPDVYVRVTSGDEHFMVVVSGRIRGPELTGILERFRLSQGSPNPTPIPLQLIVCETTRQFARWWPQDPGEFNTDGTYVAPAYLGGKGIDSARDDEVFQLRLLILDRSDRCLTEALESLDETPRHLFLSAPLTVQVRRP
jgi:hypothetical protein